MARGECRFVEELATCRSTAVKEVAVPGADTGEKSMSECGVNSMVSFGSHRRDIRGYRLPWGVLLGHWLNRDNGQNGGSDSNNRASDKNSSTSQTQTYLPSDERTRTDLLRLLV